MGSVHIFTGNINNAAIQVTCAIRYTFIMSRDPSKKHAMFAAGRCCWEVQGNTMTWTLSRDQKKIKIFSLPFFIFDRNKFHI